MTLNPTKNGENNNHSREFTKQNINTGIEIQKATAAHFHFQIERFLRWSCNILSQLTSIPLKSYHKKKIVQDGGIGI